MKVILLINFTTLRSSVFDKNGNVVYDHNTKQFKKENFKFTENLFIPTNGLGTRMEIQNETWEHLKHWKYKKKGCSCKGGDSGTMQPVFMLSQV